MRIDFLVNHPDKTLVVSEMVYSEFVVNTASQKSFEDVYNHFSKLKPNTLPITFIALLDDQCVGTVSIFENDLESRKDYKPWLASLFVAEEYRGNGIAQKLID